MTFFLFFDCGTENGKKLSKMEKAKRHLERMQREMFRQSIIDQENDIENTEMTKPPVFQVDSLKEVVYVLFVYNHFVCSFFQL